jgi:hypothetical protein
MPQLGKMPGQPFWEDYIPEKRNQYERVCDKANEVVASVPDTEASLAQELLNESITEEQWRERMINVRDGI